MRYTAHSYDQVLKKAEELASQVESLATSLTLRSGRFQSYFETLQTVNTSLKNGTLDSYLPANNKRGEIFFALKQLSEMSMIFEQLLPLASILKGQEKESLLERFSVILGGPIYPSEETEKNSKARNFQFELLVAARFKQRGYSNIKFLHNPDVLIRTNGRTYPIECKRVFSNSESSLLKRAKEAVDQLYAHPLNDSIGGIIALDMSRKYEGPSNILESRSLQSAEDFTLRQLEQDMNIIRKRSETVRKATGEGKLVAMFMSLSGVYVIPSTNQFGWVHEMAVMVFNAEYPAGAAIFMNDLKKFGTS